MITSTLDLYLKAKEGKYAVGAFNVSTIEAIKAVIQAAVDLNAPIVIETSVKEMEYLGAENIVDIVKNIAEELGIPVGIHLDHGKKIEDVKTAIEAGYTSVHLDGSSLPLNENIALTKEVVELAHAKGITVEGEVGHIEGSSEKHNEEINLEKDSLTDPKQAAEFVKETGVDILASAIGNIHGIYSKEPELDFERLAEIAKIGIPLSLHGGSGIPKEQVEKAIELGITKVNVNTELRMAYTNTLRKELAEEPDEIVPYKYLPEEIEAIKEVVEEKIRLFGSMNKG